MAALDFPASPTNGQVYQNWIYSSSKGAWQAKPMVSAKTVTSDVAPGNPANGDEWLNTLDGCLYIYYVDVDGGQWVQVKNDASFSSELGPTVDALNAGANTNYIINGAFEINQRNFSSTTTSGVYGFDRWRLYTVGGTTTYSAQQFTPGTAPAAGVEGTNFARIATSGQSTAGSYSILNQQIEGVRTLAGQTTTISFWAKAASGTPKVAVELGQVFGSGGSASPQILANAGNVTLSTSWARYSVTVALPSISGKTIAGGDDSLYLFLFTSAGSDYNARTGSIGIQNNTIDFWGVQVQAGSKATAFHRAASTLQGELAACQRYYYRFNVSSVGTSGNPRLTTGYVLNTTAAEFPFRFAVPMRTVPTSFDASAANTFATYNAASGVLRGSSITSGLTDSSNEVGHLQLTITGGSMTQSQSIGLLNYGGTACYLGWSAEL